MIRELTAPPPCISLKDLALPDCAVNFDADAMKAMEDYKYIRIGEHIHAGGVATCTALAVCDDCRREYGKCGHSRSSAALAPMHIAQRCHLYSEWNGNGKSAAFAARWIPEKKRERCSGTTIKMEYAWSAELPIRITNRPVLANRPAVRRKMRIARRPGMKAIRLYGSP